MNTKYIWLLVTFIAFAACNNDDDSAGNTPEPLPALTAGTADFSNYVAVGNSLTAGYTDKGLFIAGQQNSIPNILAQKFALVGGGNFSIPFMSDNTGGVLLGGTQIVGNRLVFNGSAPVPLEDLIGPVTPTTDLAVNNPTGPFNNMGVPGAKSFHLLFNGYGSTAGLLTVPPTANPYFVRMASSPTATVLGDAMAQNPSFFSLWAGNNDVLGYALSGGDGTDPITDQSTFEFAFGTLVSTLTSGGAQGVVANIPYINSLPHFTTVPYNAVPLDAATAAQLNAAFAAYNGGLQYVVDNTPYLTQEEADRRMVNFVEGQNAVLILDEDLTDLTGVDPALTNMRQATEDDLLVLSSSSFIGTVVGGNPQFINGVSVPLEDKWVLIPSEQAEIKAAVDSFNAVIKNSVETAGLAFLDANALMNQLASSGLPSGDFILTAALVRGGAFSLDGVHPTARGNAVLANEFLKAIDVQYGSNFEASGNLLDAGDFPTSYPATLQ